MPNTVSTAVPMHRLAVSIATVYWLAEENLSASGLPRTRMRSSNVRPPANSEANIFRAGEATPMPVVLAVTTGKKPFSHEKVLGELEISLDPFLGVLPATSQGGTFILELRPPADTLSAEPAGPSTGDDNQNRPGNCGVNNKFDGLFRPLRLKFELAFGAEGKPIVSHLQNADEGFTTRGPHWMAVVHPDPASTNALERIMLDWKPDWIRRVSPQRRPKLSIRGPQSQVEMVVLHNISGGLGANNLFPNGAAAITNFLLVQVKVKRGGVEVIDPATGEAKMKDQDSGIHYVVDVDGHVTKMAHEAFHTQHGEGGFPHDWGNLQHRGRINRVSIGIEHALLKKDPVFYPAMIDASVDLVHQIATHFPSFRPWNVVGHSNVTKGRDVCVGINFPWRMYESVTLGEVGSPARPVAMALGAYEDYYPDLNVVYDGFFNTHPDGAMGVSGDGIAESRAAVRELQQDLRRIGLLFHRINGRYDDNTRHSVREFHSRFMNGSHISPQNFTRDFVKVVDRQSAIQIKRVVNMLDFLETVSFPLPPF